MPNRSNLNRGNDSLIPGKAVDGNGTVRPLLADTVTGRLLVEITADAGGATGVTGNARIDENNVSTLLALSDDGSGDLIPLARDADGNILCDAIYE